MVSIAQHYHHRTKYHPDTLANQARPLDFSQQPIPFKTYPIGSEIDLKPYLDARYNQPSLPHDQAEWSRISRLLINSYGLTAKVATPSGEPFYLRAAPSAGGLYPAELYLISRGTTLLPAGLYNYQVRTHSLWRYWDAYLWQDLQKACFWHPCLETTQLALVVTAVFQRSAWRYQDRAYRRIALDSGHLLGNLALAGTLTDYRPHLIGSFADGAINQLLYLNEAEEGTLAVVPLANLLAVDQNLSAMAPVLPAPRHSDFPDLVEGDLLPYLHRSTALPATVDGPSWQRRQSADPAADPAYTLGSQVTPRANLLDWGTDLQALEAALLGRRSTRRFSGAPVSLAQLGQVLEFTYRPEAYVAQGFDPEPDFFCLPLLQTFVAASGIEGLDVGCYHYNPATGTLRQVRFKHFRQELHYLCLGQDLGRDAAAVIFHTANLDRAVATYGDRVYRYLHMDAGHLGQRLSLAAVRLGLGVSGIGGFFDDQVNEVLGIPPAEAVIYITTLGQPAQRA